MKENHPIYLDYMASTPIDDHVIKKMLPILSDRRFMGNPSARHYYGDSAMSVINDAKMQVADLINSDPDEIIWTSGATEANNLALKGIASFYKRNGKHIISNSIEHMSVLGPLEYLKNQGFEVTLIEPEPDGCLNIDKFTSAIRDDTVLVSIMHVNNEIGVIQDIAKIGSLCRSQGIVFHVDAAQSAGKIEIDVNKMKVDLLSLSAHKVYGPKGIGALYISNKPKIRIDTVMHGGGQQLGLRSGTLPTPLIVGMGEACRIAKAALSTDYNNIKSFSNNIIENLNQIDDVFINGSLSNRIPHNINFSVDGVNMEALLCALRGLAISTGASCVTKTFEGSYVLKAIGLSDQLAQNTIRMSLGRFTTKSEIDKTIDIVTTQIKRLRNMSCYKKSNKNELS